MNCQLNCHKIIPLTFENSLSYYEIICKLLKKIIDIANEANLLTDENLDLINSIANNNQNELVMHIKCNKVLPIEFDDSLSYFEVICKLLNKIVEIETNSGVFSENNRKVIETITKNFREISDCKINCKKVLPLIYDDSLSYYEVICKLTYKVNELLESGELLTPEDREELNNLLVIANDSTRVYQGALLGLSAVQPEAGKGLFSGNYNDLTNKPTIPTALSQLNSDSEHRVVTDEDISTWDGKYTKPSAGIPASDLANGVIPTALSQLSGDSTHRTVTDAEKEAWNGKQNAITDLAVIRSGAAAGATAYQKPTNGIPASDLASGVIPTVPTQLSQLTEDSTHRTVTDAEKEAWNGKQNALGYTPEKVGKITVDDAERNIVGHTLTVVTDGVASTFNLVGWTGGPT